MRGFRCRWAAAEALEARVLLASERDLAAVGLVFDEDDGFTPYFAELVWAEDRSISGDVYLPSSSGPGDPDPTALTDLINGRNGSLRPSFNDDNLDLVLGGRFEDSDDYPAGWMLGAKDDGSLADFSVIIERSPDVTAADLAGEWVFLATRVTSQGTFTYHSLVSASLNGSGGFFAVADGASGDPLYAGEGFQYDGSPENGRFELALPGGDTGVFYVSRDESVILFADLDEGDADSWMGVLVRPGASMERDDVDGSYRMGVLAEGERTVNLFQGPAATWQIDLDSDGDFKGYLLSRADEGDPGEAALEGSWTISGDGVAKLTDTATQTEIWLKFGEGGRTAQVTRFRSATTGLYERPMGVATLITPDADITDTTVVSGILDGERGPMVFDLRRTDDAWSVVDLDRYALGDALGANPADVAAFQASDGRVVAAVTTDTGLFAMVRDTGGFWRATDLTAALDDAENITSAITVFNDTGGGSHVAGLTEAGEVATYTFDPDADGGAGEWSYVNISDTHLAPQGEQTPVFVGPLISYVTRWNGLTIAGLDAEGNIQTVWSGNGGSVWHASDLTAITKAPAMTSGLTAYLTSWDGINIVGLDTGGRMVAAWWVPSFGGQWRQADLTTASQGPVLSGSSLTSFVAPWGALNVAGLDANGDVVAYWWVPLNEENGLGWEWVNLTQNIPANQPRPTDQLQSQTNTSHGGELNILGTDAESGELLRLFWRVGGSWQVENVSGEAAYV